LKNLKVTGWSCSSASIVGVEGKPSNGWSSLARSQRRTELLGNCVTDVTLDLPIEPARPAERLRLGFVPMRPGNHSCGKRPPLNGLLAGAAQSVPLQGPSSAVSRGYVAAAVFG